MGKSMMITRCMFKRTETSDWERGIAIGADEGTIDVIVTFHGESIPSPIWTYELQMFAGLMWLHP